MKPSPLFLLLLATATSIPSGALAADRYVAGLGDDDDTSGDDEDSAGSAGDDGSSCAGCQSSLSGAAGATAQWLVPLLGLWLVLLFGLRRRRNEALR